VLRVGGRLVIVGQPKLPLLRKIAEMGNGELNGWGFKRITPRGRTFRTAQSTIKDTEDAEQQYRALGGTVTGGGGAAFDTSIYQQVVLQRTS
jgi:hypothetical protein